MPTGLRLGAGSGIVIAYTPNHHLANMIAQIIVIDCFCASIVIIITGSVPYWFYCGHCTIIKHRKGTGRSRRSREGGGGVCVWCEVGPL